LSIAQSEVYSINLFTHKPFMVTCILIQIVKGVAIVVSSSAVVKLKAILVIDLIIVGAAAGVYFYFQGEGLIGSASKAATFTFSDLSISPDEAFVGEAVQISVNVTNIGDLEGNQTVNLQINDVIKDSMNMTLSGHTNETVQFTDIELEDGTFNVTIGDLSGVFLIKPAPPESSKIILSNLKTDPYEGWIGDNITVTATAQNPTNELDRITIRVTVDDVLVQSQLIELEAGTSQAVNFTVNALSEGKHTVKLNTLSGSFVIVETGFHTLVINRSGGGSKPLPFTLDGEEHNTPYTVLLPVGQHRISVPNPFSVGTGVLEFSYWSDGSRSADRTFTLDNRLYLIVTYTLISGYASCPSLYVWNGTGYSYVTDVSNPGWLGYIGYMTSSGDIVFNGGNPWDYVKLDSSLIAANNGFFDLTLAQQWNELYYLDSASLMVVDHPVGTDVYTSMTNYLNKGSTGQIYTVDSARLSSPVSATNEQGQSVLDQILQKDGVYTPGINGDDSIWNNITQNQLILNLGDLSNATEIKLVITGMVDWGLADPYYAWISQFKEAAAQGLVSNGTEIMPAPTMEIKAADGSWIRAPQDRQIPLPSDFNARTFTVDLTGLFPVDISDYQVRFTNFWNVTYDYIGIDTTVQQNVIITNLSPSSAVMDQMWDTQSSATGAFTRYGDVTPLVQSADDMFVIGRQGDQVNLQFSTDALVPVADGMVRDYFFTVACWFKDPPGEWGYGFAFTVDPLPFMAMTGFPYPSTESYPTDSAHQAYLQEYNTRIISAP
jgi:hypothetical protein